MSTGLSPENSAIRLTPEQEAHVNELHGEEIAEYLKNLAVEQNLVRRDIYSPDVLIPTNQPQPKAFAKAITINHTKYVIEAASESELVQQETALYRSLLQGTESATQAASVAATEQPRGDDGRFVAAESVDDGAEVARLTELRLKMMRGEIDVNTYLRESGELDNYVRENFGIVPVKEQKFIQSWEAATAEFISKNPEWLGGPNAEVMKDLIFQNNLTDSPSVETLERVYSFMKENGLEVENPEVTKRDEIAQAELKKHSDIEQISLSDTDYYERLKSAAHRAIGLPETAAEPWTFDKRGSGLLR